RFQRIECDPVRQIGNVEKNYVCPAALGNQFKHLANQIATRIDDGKAFALRGALSGHVGKQGGLACPGLPNDVHVGAPIPALDAKALWLVAEIGLANASDFIHCFSVRREVSGEKAVKSSRRRESRGE